MKYIQVGGGAEKLASGAVVNVSRDSRASGKAGLNRSETRFHFRGRKCVVPVRVFIEGDVSFFARKKELFTVFERGEGGHAEDGCRF